MNIILFDANSTSPVSELIAVAPGECILINAWGLDAGEIAQVFRAYVALGSIPEQSGVCEPPKRLIRAQQQSEVAYLPCNVTVAVGETVDQNLTSLVLSQPGFYRLHLTPSALGTAVVEAVVLKGAEACEQAASQCCCVPETFFVATSTNPCLVITPGGEAGHRPTFSLDACCLLHAFPGLPVPVGTDELIVLSGGSCFRSTIDQVFDPAIICTTIGNYLLQLPAIGDTLVVVDAGANCKRVDGETFVEFFETPWTGISVNPFLTIAAGGINGHGPTFDYDLCGDLQAIAPCACEPIPGDLIPIIRGGACQLAQFPIVDVCDQMGALPVGALVAGDLVMLRDAGGNCKQVDAFALAIPFDGGTITNPILAANGACATPSYSFTASPDSGMFYDPAGVGSVVIGDDNCADSITIGASITLQTAASTISLLSGAGVQITATNLFPVNVNAETISVVAATGANVSAGNTLTLTSPQTVQINATLLAQVLGGAVQIQAQTSDVLINSPAGNVSVDSSALVTLDAGNQLEIITNAVSRLTIDSTGAWLLPGSAGVAGQVITSQGPGLPPVWAPIAAFPILAPDGSCAAPSYSFSTDPTSGMFFDPGTPALMLGHDTCDSFIRIGDIIRIEAANGDFVQYGASMLTQIAGGTRIELTNAAPIVGRGVSNLFSVFAAGPTQAALLQGGNATAGTPAGEGWVRGGDSFFAGQNGGAAVIDAGDANNVGSTAGDAIISGGRGLTGGTAGTIILRTSALTRASINAAGAFLWGGSAGTAGQSLVSNGAGAPPTWQDRLGGQVVWAAANIDATANTKVMPVGYESAMLDANTPKGYLAPRAGTFRNMFARHNTANGNGNTVTYTLRVNGINTALAVTLATGAIGSNSNLVTTVAVAQGDLIEVTKTNALGLGNGVQEAFVSAQFN